jgi:hypothetical protein
MRFRYLLYRVIVTILICSPVYASRLEYFATSVTVLEEQSDSRGFHLFGLMSKLFNIRRSGYTQRVVTGLDRDLIFVDTYEEPMGFSYIVVDDHRATWISPYVKTPIKIEFIQKESFDLGGGVSITYFVAAEGTFDPLFHDDRSIAMHVLDVPSDPNKNAVSITFPKTKRGQSEVEQVPFWGNFVRESIFARRNEGAPDEPVLAKYYEGWLENTAVFGVPFNFRKESESPNEFILYQAQVRLLQLALTEAWASK